jgi:glyceraldehyde 3-phosphate dehydrogenase
MKIAINGFGRIGRIFFRQIYNHPEMEIAAVNDLGDKENLLYLTEHDSVYGQLGSPASTWKQDFQKIKFLQEKEPGNLPWKDLDIDVVIESTGFFTSYEKAKAHLDAGAKRVVITAPVKTSDVDGETSDVEKVLTFTPNVIPGNIARYKITSNASCTTNAVNPVMAVMLKNPGIKKALLNTVHAYTSTQALVDGPCAKDFRRGRAAGINIVPSTTGAAEATIQSIPEIKDKFDGVAIRVPIVCGSIIDFTFISKRKTSKEEINNIFKKASQEPEWKGILKVSEEPLVSADILAEPFGSIIDATLTRVVDEDLVKVFSWYDNEWGYCAMLIKHIEMLKKYL